MRCAKTKEDGGVVIVNVAGEGASWCHHKRGEHGSSQIFFQIHRERGRYKDKAVIFQRCFSPKTCDDDGVRCRDWNRSGKQGMRAELPFAVAATLFASFRSGHGAGAQNATDDVGQEASGTETCERLQQMPAHRRAEVKAAAKKKRGHMDDTYLGLLTEGCQVFGERVLPMDAQPAWQRTRSDRATCSAEIALIREHMKGRGSVAANAPPPAKRVRAMAGPE